MNSEAVYEVYVDILYGNCVVMNYMILTLTGIFLGRSATRRRRLLVSVLCAGINCACILLPEIPDGIRSVLGYGLSGILALVLTFEMKAGDGLLHGVICVYLLTFLYGGCLSFLEDRIPYLRRNGYTMPVLLAVGCGCYEIIRAVHSNLKKSRAHRERLYRVCFQWNGRTYSCIGLYDTGNQLYEPIRKVPVCILEREMLAEEFGNISGDNCSAAENYFDAVIPYHSLGCRNGLLYGIFLEQVKLEPVEPVEESRSKRNDRLHEDCKQSVFVPRVLAGLSTESVSGRGSYQMILHPDLFTAQEAFHDRKECST